MFDKTIFTLRGIGPVMAFSCLASVLRALCVVGQAWGFAATVVNVWSGDPLTDQFGWIALFFSCFVARQVVQSASSAFIERFAAEKARDLREQLLKSVFSLGPVALVGHGTGAVVTSALEGIENVSLYLSLMIGKIAAVVMVPLVLLVGVFSLDWVSGVIALACYPFIMLYMAMIGYTAKDDAAKRHGEFERMSNHFVDSLRGIDTLRSFGLVRGFGEVVFASSERFRELTMKTLRIAQLSGAVLDMFSTLALAAVAIMLGFRLVDGSLSFFPALAVLVMVPEYFRPIREFAADYHASLDGKTALSSINELVAEADASNNDGADRSRDALVCSRLSEADDDMGLSLAVDGVSYSYGDGGNFALKDVTFSVGAPCRVGIIGASGSGKSTLVNVLGGFVDPSEGSCVRVNGFDVKGLRNPGWHSRVALIPQHPYLFHASLRDNVAFYEPEASDEDIERVLESLGMADELNALPRRLEEPIGFGARMFSGGQMQRIALARALLSSSRDVLIFDEPTAHLDIETEFDLKPFMLEAMDGRLVFFATHRLHWIDDMDYVLVMDGGRVVWQGAPYELRGTDVLERAGVRHDSH